MKIHLPNRQKRDLPPEKDLTEVVSLFCEKTGLNSDGVALNVTGGDWDHRINKIGVRVVSFNQNNPYSIHVLIGCKNNSVRAYISYSEKGNGVKAEVLYRRFSPFFETPNEKFISLEGSPKKLEEKKSPVAESEPATPPQTPVTQPEKVEKSAVTEVTQTEPPVDYKVFFKDEKNVHLAVLALVTQFNLTSRVFDFEEFTQVMRDDVGIKLEKMKMASMVGRFTRGGFIVHRNPGKSSAVYSITAKAIEYASLTPVPVNYEKPGTEQPKKVAPKPVAVVEDVSDPLAPLLVKLTALKKAEGEYQQALSAISHRSQQQSKLDLQALAKEDGDITAEMANIEKRLLKLRERKTEIQQIGVHVSTLQTEINALKEDVRTKRLQEQHEQFLAMEKQTKELRAFFDAKS